MRGLQALIIALLLILRGAGMRVAAATDGPAAALAQIGTNGLITHTRTLASDEFEGRAPGTPGEERTIEYLVAEFKRLGLQPGNPDGTYIQKVPLAGFTSSAEVAIVAADHPLELSLPKDCVAWSRRLVPKVTVPSSEMVFVGYGIVAPEYRWDDYKDVDVHGKIIVMLINDPPVPDPKDPSKLDEKMFNGRAMTYYGRWTYKYEIATAKGAAGAIIIHETGPAGYPWIVVIGSNTRENMDLRSPDKNMSRVAVEGWMALETAKRLFAATGHDFDTLKQQALRRDFRPISLKAKSSFTVENTMRPIESRNVIARIEGSDPKLRDEYVIYTAHWDHLGRNPKLEGDQIYNGALDNASGTAALLELAKAFSKTRPKRTIVFLSVTAEEKGLLGAKYYAEHPVYPLERTLANINIDGVNVWGRTRDIGIIGQGQNTLEDLLARLARAQGRTLRPEAEPEKGYYYRSDHFEFARKGVPALYIDKGINFIGQPPDFGKQKREEYIANDYHKVSDEMKPDWDLSGAVEDLRLLFQVGYEVAQGAQWPEWKDGSEFKTKRRR
jgi:Zn-dependent M28 family amino/carboxypeptidase